MIELETKLLTNTILGSCDGDLSNRIRPTKSRRLSPSALKLPRIVLSEFRPLPEKHPDGRRLGVDL